MACMCELCVKFGTSSSHPIRRERFVAGENPLLRDLSSANKFSRKSFFFLLLLHLVSGIVCIHNTWWFPSRDQNIRKFIFLPFALKVSLRQKFWVFFGLRIDSVRDAPEGLDPKVLWEDLERMTTCNLCEEENLYRFDEIRSGMTSRIFRRSKPWTVYFKV